MDTRSIRHSCGCTEDWFDRAIHTTQPKSLEKWDRVRRATAVEGDWHLIDPYAEPGGPRLFCHVMTDGAWTVVSYVDVDEVSALS